MELRTNWVLLVGWLVAIFIVTLMTCLACRVLTSFFFAASSAESGWVDKIDDDPALGLCLPLGDKRKRFLDALICRLMSSFWDSSATTLLCCSLMSLATHLRSDLMTMSEAARSSTLEVVRVEVEGVEGAERLARVSEKEEIRDQTSFSYLLLGLVAAGAGAGAGVEAGFAEEKGFFGAALDIGG